MLALRLALGAHPLVQLRRLSVAAASAGAGFLLLCSLGYAIAHPAEAAGSAVRLLWCALPLAAAVQLAVAVARNDPGRLPRRGLSSAGLGPVRLAVLAVSWTFATCALGSVLALLVFLLLRGDLGGAAAGSTSEFIGAGVRLPFAAVFTLLAVVPVAACTASALALRPRPAPRPRAAHPGEDERAGATVAAAAAGQSVPAGLPWGVALTAAGLALCAYSSSGAPASQDKLPMPGRLEAIPLGAVAGWALIAAGLVTALPAVTHLCGRLLAAGRPGALRLLGGRVLQQEAQRIGQPLGVLCAAATGLVAGGRLYDAAAPAAVPPLGPLTWIGAALVVLCAATTVLTVAVEARAARSDTTAALLRIGAPASLLRRAAALRALVMTAVLAPLAWATGALAALPLVR